MAKKGEEDPRWLVTSREDGRNVNNWHWTETDFTGWCKNRLQELLVGLPLESSTISGKIDSVSLSGEVSANTRKQKLIFFYEMESTIKWQASLKDKDATAHGAVNIPYISEENDYDEFEIRITVDSDDKNSHLIKESVKQVITPILKAKIPQMLTELREVGASKTLLPSKGGVGAQTTPGLKVDSPQTSPAETKQSTPVTSPPAPKATTSSTPSTTTPAPAPSTTTTTKKAAKTVSFTLKEKFVCSAADLFMCLVDPNRVKAYAGSDAVVSKDVGGAFKLFGGYVEGENLEVDFPKKLVQKWRFNKWPQGHYSTVTISFEESGGKTHLTLTQTGVPEDDKEHTESGWDTNFWSRIKGIFGYGAMF